LEGRVGSAMHHAGVAITITSVTDFIAFAIGASSSLPILRWFYFFLFIFLLLPFCFFPSRLAGELSFTVFFLICLSLFVAYSLFHFREYFFALRLLLLFLFLTGYPSFEGYVFITYF
jgi:hypothetical protein